MRSTTGLSWNQNFELSHQEIQVWVERIEKTRFKTEDGQDQNLYLVQYHPETGTLLEKLFSCQDHDWHQAQQELHLCREYQETWHCSNSMDRRRLLYPYYLNSNPVFCINVKVWDYITLFGSLELIVKEVFLKSLIVWRWRSRSWDWSAEVLAGT